MNPLIRPAITEDAHGIALVYARTWQSAYRGMMSDAYLDALTPAHWEDSFLRSPGAEDAPRGLVLEMEGRVVGASHFGETRDSDLSASCGEIVSVYLLPEYWGKGLGTALMRAALESLTALGFTACVLWTLPANQRAGRAYERLGFAPDGHRRTVPIGGEELEVIRYARPLP